jgi:hypothetical protein
VYERRWRRRRNQQSTQNADGGQMRRKRWARVENYLLLFGRAVLIQHNNRRWSRAGPHVCSAIGPIKTNTAAYIIALLAARAAQKFRLAEKLVLVLLLITNLVGFIRAKKKTCRVRGLLFDERVYVCVCALEF